jgi:hypothetical protein
MSAELQKELQKLDDMQLCYRTLCKLSTGTDSKLSEENLERLPVEYNLIVDNVLKYFSQPPSYEYSCTTSGISHTKSAPIVSNNNCNYPSVHTNESPTTSNANHAPLRKFEASFGLASGKQDRIMYHKTRPADTWEARIHTANESAAFI